LLSWRVHQKGVAMYRHLLNRLIQGIAILFGVLVLVFVMVRATGDPASLMMPRDASPAAIQAFRHAMGFDQPLPVQFWAYLRGVAVGDFGNSLYYKTPSLPLILQRLPATLELAFAALLMAVAVGLPLGLAAGANPGTVWDNLGRTIGLLGQSIPNFWLALVMIIIFAVNLRWLPSFGRTGMESVLMPAFVLGLPCMAAIVRLTRSAVLEIRSADFVRTAYGKGLPRWRVYVDHILRNAAIPLVGVIGVQFGYMLGGSIYIETIFAWPGMGTLIADAVSHRDFLLIQAIAFFTSAVIVTISLLTDFLYALLDPRIRYAK
jgi:ABC-type dipeptide/oligopeptide/nickel transport system permease component